MSKVGLEKLHSMLGEIQNHSATDILYGAKFQTYISRTKVIAKHTFGETSSYLAKLTSLAQREEKAFNLSDHYRLELMRSIQLIIDEIELTSEQKSSDIKSIGTTNVTNSTKVPDIIKDNESMTNEVPLDQSKLSIVPSEGDRPSVFIGSSAEGLKFAEAIQANLEYVCESQIWSQGLFGLSDGTLDTLVRSLNRFDFAVLVITGDDITISRKETLQSPRDNVIFELGLFIGGLGKDRVFFVVDRSIKTKLPSDLAGITPATFVPPIQGSNQSAVGTACTQIKGKISELGYRNKQLAAPAEINYEIDLAVIETYLKSKNKTMISFEGLLKYVSPRYDQPFITNLIEAFPQKITRATLKNDVAGVKIITNNLVNPDDLVPTYLKQSIEEYLPTLLGPNELPKAIQALFATNYDYFLMEDIRKACNVAIERLNKLFTHLEEHGFLEKVVGTDGQDYWKLLNLPLKIISATYQWSNGSENITDNIRALVRRGILEGLVDPKTFGIGDPKFAEQKTLALHYRIYGKEKSRLVKDGDQFRVEL